MSIVPIKKYSIAFVSIHVSLLIGSAACAAPYKWVDSSGQIHYSQIPPKNRQAKQVDVPGNNQTPKQHPTENATTKPESSEDDALKEQEQEEKKMLQKMASLRRQKCLNAKHDLLVLDTSTRVRIKDGESERFIDDKEREERITKARKQISDLCKE